MVTYVAFLRAINVGGHKLIKMEALRRAFESLGCKNVRTYIQSGNVIFDSASVNSVTLSRKIEKRLKEVFGHEVTVILRELSELEALVKRNPFKRVKADAGVMLFAVFLSEEPKTKPKLPLVSTTENLEVFEIKDRAAFIVSRRGFPNLFVEKQLGVLGTTRNWNTVNKIVRFAEIVDGKPAKRKQK